ncbi:MAG: YfhO family protein, partial [Clostridioides sp.]|nr:YfhO family protein [Clostridioides sp.]
LNININPTDGKKFFLAVNDTLTQKESEDERWVYPIDEYSFKLNGSTKEIVIQLSKGNYKINKIDTNFTSYKNLEKTLSDRNKYNLENLYIKGNTIIGTINNKEDGILALNMPCVNGWQLKVNGYYKDIVKVNKFFVGVPLKKGDNIIELNYKTPMLRQGMYISVLTLIVCIQVVIYKKIRRKKNSY